MENNKLITTAGNMDRIVKIVGGFMKAFVIVFAVFAVLVAVFGEKMFMTGNLSVDLDFVTVYLAEGYGEITPFVRLHTVIGLACLAVLCWVVILGIRLVRELLAPMKEGRPFDAQAPVQLKKLGWIVLISGAALQLVSVAERAVMVAAFPMEQIFSSPAISSVDYVFTVDFGFVWVFCIIRFLACIFEYGQRLQQESDETL